LFGAHFCFIFVLCGYDEQKPSLQEVPLQLNRPALNSLWANALRPAAANTKASLSAAKLPLLRHPGARSMRHLPSPGSALHFAV